MAPQQANKRSRDKESPDLVDDEAEEGDTEDEDFEPNVPKKKKKEKKSSAVVDAMKNDKTIGKAMKERLTRLKGPLEDLDACVMLALDVVQGRIELPEDDLVDLKKLIDANFGLVKQHWNAHTLLQKFVSA